MVGRLIYDNGPGLLLQLLQDSGPLLLIPLLRGRNASKQNLLVDSPDMVRAVIHAAGPGREVTWIPAS